MNLAVIGCGSIGSRHARNAVALGHTVMLADSNHERTRKLAEEFNYKVGWVGGATDDTALVGAALGMDETDAALICTPASTHAQVARDLLANGYRGPLFVEKPLAMSVAECEAFRSWPHPTTMVGYMLRFNVDALKLRASRPTHGALDVQWKAREGYADCILESSHEIDLALWFGADPTEISVARLDAHHFDIAIGRWSVEGCDVADEYIRTWTVGGERFDRSVWFHGSDQLGANMYEDELRHFLACAAGSCATKTPFADGIRVLEVIDKAKQLAGVPV